MLLGMATAAALASGQVSAQGVFAEYQKHDKLDIDAWLVGVDFRF